MRMLGVTAAALALLTAATAHADDLNTARGMMTASLYDLHCEKIPGLEAQIRTMLAIIPASTMRAGIAQASEYFRSMATTKFCETAKPFVAAARAYWAIREDQLSQTGQ